MTILLRWNKKNRIEGYNYAQGAFRTLYFLLTPQYVVNTPTYCCMLRFVFVIMQ